MREIDYSRLRSLPARRLIRALLDDGFTFNRQRDSHHRYRHPDGRRVSVAFTRVGETIPIGTLQFISKNKRAGMPMTCGGWNCSRIHQTTR
ncbi:MAG: addiction module toxin, HicA family [Chloroflexi bacterium]|nr:addiction module toxin, HicA family [Chloroflexota bacterium]MYE40101.1 addiction module toxin, HicA family [Chloroflexota bacterium]